MKNRFAALAATLLVVGLSAGCELPEDDITKGENAFSEDGNGKQSKKDKPKAEKKDSGPQLTPGQENAIRSAQSYLDGQAFSKKGLIDQLKFEQYSPKDATFAVNHIKVNWNDEAAESAKGYLDGQSFSRQGLIDQLVFEGFTPAQATYGVNQTGL